MALGKKCKSSLNSKRAGVGGGGGLVAAAEGLELGFVKYTRALGRKRIGITNNGEANSPGKFSPKTPLKRQRSGKLVWGSETSTSAIEALPQEILIKIVCGVDHEDLKQLFQVSKPIREATMIAKEWHFAYSTPSKTPAFRNAIDFSDSNNFMDEIEAPNAPKQWRQLHRPMLSRNKLADISVNLFADFMDEDE